MISLDTTATEVFQILRSYDYTVMMYDDDGNQVYEPEGARRFFAKPENLLVSLVDSGDNSSIRLYLGKSTDISDVIGLDQTLRMTATKYNMIFNVRRYGRDLQPIDFSTKASVTEDKKEDTMNILEGMYGTTRSSYLKLENARMIVRHSKKIDEMIMGSRGRHIDAIFVENAQGERFLFPTRQLSPARAMTQHVNHGGGFADQVGQQIIRMATDYANLGQASGYIASNSNQLSESALGIRETCRNRMYEMRKCFERLARAGGYLNEAQRIEEECNTLNENESTDVLTDLTEVRGLLTVEGEELDEGILASIAEAMKACECDVDEGRVSATEIRDPCKACNGRGDIGLHQCKACGGSGVESKSILGRPVQASAWDAFVAGHLEFFHKPTDELADPTGHGAGKPRFINRDAKLSYLLGQVVPEVKNDSMMNFLGYVAEQLAENNDPKRQAGLRGVAVQAIRLAGLSLDEGFSPNNEVVREFSDWLDGFRPGTVLAEREDDDYEDEPDSERYSADGDPSSSATGAHEDAMDRAAETVCKEFDPEDFFKTCGNDFNWGDESLEGDDLKYDKAYILNSLSHYLSEKVEETSGFEDVDMDVSAKELWPKIEPMLTQAGYQLSEDALSREDMVIQTNQGADLKREVTKPASTDPYSGEMVPTDSAYVSRIRTLAGLPWRG